MKLTAWSQSPLTGMDIMTGKIINWFTINLRTNQSSSMGDKTHERDVKLFRVFTVAISIEDIQIRGVGIDKERSAVFLPFKQKNLKTFM